ncbi:MULTISPECIES: diguanylate cyclase [unclassified Treponema]|uniref:ligand-binding sensor domain-containing protein n=1 Tax=unclassified Treponema TaxID=2638727 RepID=UPI0005301106|nr:MULTISPECIES: diguanylate cyclase [unclassified Treponema]AIW88834.1 diguanylate cyclase [Treponema sp. OMZ 838]UTC44376.1 diguanylate cyclase [Treponema sp. OMZ 857]UTC51216.1 diguanylate cyclase [Treponema sp. OMZ 855]
MKYFITFVSILFLMAGLVFCTDLTPLSFYTEPALFPFNAVVGIVEDSHECLYFATHSGLIKYNGITTQKYEHLPFDNTTMRSSQIQTMYMDTDDVLWLGTYNGLERFDIKSGTINHFPVSDDVITAIFRDSKRHLWVGTINGLYFCRDGSCKNFIPFNNHQYNSFIGNNTIRSISEDSRGIIYASTYDGVWQYNESEGSFEPCSLIPEGCPGKNGVVYHFIEDTNGVYWLSVWGVGLVRITPGKNSYEVYSLPDARIYTLYNNFITNEYIAAGTWGGGIYIINKRTKEVIPYKANPNMVGSLTNNVIYSFFINKYNMLFVGTADALNIADLSRQSGDIAVPLYTETAGNNKKLSHLDDTIACLASSDNCIWAASNNILVRYNFNEREPEEFPVTMGKNEVNGAIIYSISVVNDTKAWIGTNKGLFFFDSTTASFTPISLYNNRISDTSSFLVHSLYQDSDDTLWIGTYGAGLIHFSPENGILEQYRHSDAPRSLSNDIVFFINRDSRGTLWIGTNKGLCRYIPETEDFTSYLYNVNKPTGISSNRVDSFCEDLEGTLWFGTNDGGICRFDPKTELFHTYTKDVGLSSNQIIGITDADDGFLWIAGLKYLNLFDIAHETAQAYNIANIRQYGYFSCPPIALKNKGLFFFGTDKGILKISQEKLYAFRLQFVPIKIRALTADGQPVNLYTKKQPLTFDYKTNDIKISFAAPYSSRHKKPVYAYKLTGIDKDWIVSSDRNYVRYTHLPPGSYTFSVKNAAEGKNIVHDSISFTIRQSFLISPVMIWFYIVVVSIMVFLAYKIHKLYWLQRYADLLEEKQLVLIQDNFTLKELSLLDHLTGIGNRRYIDMLGLKIWQMAMEHKTSIAVMMFDIDFFKNYNDRFGHQAGDELLHLIGADLKKRIRTETDLIGRYGGEEFLIVMYNLLPEKAMHIAEGIRKTIATMHERHAKEMVGEATISIGVFAGEPTEKDTFEHMIHKADCALYRAKQTGRNKVVFYDTTMEQLISCN